MQRPLLGLLPVILLASTALACAHGAGSSVAHLKGTATYRQRIALTPEATLEVELVDASLADAPAVVIAQQTLQDPGQVPIRFDLVYDPSRVDASRRYLVQARITDRGAPRFVSDAGTPVLTRGASDQVALVLRMVSGADPDDSEPPLGSR